MGLTKANERDPRTLQSESGIRCASKQPKAKATTVRETPTCQLPLCRQARWRDGPKWTNLRAQTAARAQRFINRSNLAIESDGGAPYCRNALLAARAYFRIDRNRSLGFNEIHARRAEDNRRRALERNRLRDRIDTLIKMMGVGELDAFHAKRLEDAFDRKRHAFPSHERVARARMRLPTRHSRSGIIEHAHRDVVLVVYGIGNAVMPLAKNVESPTKASSFAAESTTPRPCAIVMPAPIHKQVSTASSGLALPKV